MTDRIYPCKEFHNRRSCAPVALFVIVLLTVSLFSASARSATIPVLSDILPLDKNKSDTALKAVTPEQQLKITRQALAAAEAARDRALAGSSGGLIRQDAKEKFRLLDGHVTRLNSQLSLINEREDVRRTRILSDQKAKSWSGFEEPPPYSILMVDEIMISLLTARDKSEGFGINRKLLERQVEQYRESAKQAREIERQAADELDRAKSSEERVTAAQQKELAGIGAANAETMAELITLRYEVLGERLGVAEVELELLERQLSVARKQMVFSRGDLREALARLKTSRASLEQELDATLAHDAQSRSSLAQLRKELDSFTRSHSKTDRSTATIARRDELEAEQRAALAWVDTSSFETEVVAALITINKSTAAFWEQRYTAVTGTDAKQLRAILADFRTSREQLKPWLAVAKQQLDMYQAAEHEQELRLAKIPRQGVLRTAESRLLAARQLQRELAERQKAAVEHADAEQQSWREDIERIQQTRSFMKKMHEWFTTVPGVLSSIWRFELFAIEDSVEVAGQQIVTSRGVTVGKSVGAILLFLIGYLVAAFLGRRAQRLMITRFRVSEHQANVIRRWLMALTVFILLIITLNLARIPLTVFAFLGGALAIGVGFGTQTLIKNFISGILILLERNVKVGDTVDVDGVVGRVITVDIRASTILGFDGVETVIPNSTFLDNKVTNWTHSNARLRRIVKVGVSYGSPTTLVRDVLTECGNAHNLILKTPPPEALFEDFGESSLIFALYFWIEHGPETNPLLVTSDLRFMIEKRFTEENIRIAFPQRDVHLDTTEPLRFEMLSRNTPETENSGGVNP
ncbi:MAG: mechanosensitive ion channel [Desulfuromonadaceae bacterium]|nr:mechanosensitive ion channel [Desulfuromonadaceae bacterium]